MKYIRHLYNFLDSELSEIGLNEDSYEISFEYENNGEEFYSVAVFIDIDTVKHLSISVSINENKTESILKIQRHSDGVFEDFNDCTFNVRRFWIALLL